jgi:hypothetical protein
VNDPDDLGTMGGMSRNIIPFVSDARETMREFVCYSWRSDIHSKVEAFVEVTLIVVGILGVIACAIGA